MSKSAKQPIKNAVEIIEKFGGIRPMASKIDVAVTTIQGWKKRNVIPAGRKDALIKAAQAHGIDLSEYISDAPVIVSEAAEENESASEAKATVSVETNDDSSNSVDTVIEGDVEDLSTTTSVPSENESDDAPKDAEKIVAIKKDEFRTVKPPAQNNAYTELAVETKSRAITQSAAIAASVVFVILVLIIAMMWPNFKSSETPSYDTANTKNAQNTIDLEIADADETEFKGLVSDDWSKQLDQLKQQAQRAKESVGSTVSDIQESSQKIISDNGLDERVEQLQNYVTSISTYTGYGGLVDRFESFRTGDKQKNIDQSVQTLLPIFENTEGRSEEELNAILDQARQESPALQSTLGDVPVSDLKAAAILLAMTEVRSSLYRDDAQFNDDLELLMRMVGDDDPELMTSLKKLAPHAKAGTLSSTDLTEDFVAFRDQIIASSLSGDDVSLTEKLSARFNDMLKVEKDGVPVTGTQTQSVMSVAENLLNAGQIGDAMAHLKESLTPKQLEIMQPWMIRAEVRMAKQRTKNSIEKSLNLDFGGNGYLGGSQTLRSSTSGGRSDMGMGFR